MGTCTNTQVVPKLPVIEVVATAVSGFCISRYLVAFQALQRRQFRDAVEHRIGSIVFWNDRRELGEVGVGLDRQVVNREMRGGKAQRGGDIGIELLHGLTRQRIHQVEIERAKGPCRLFHCRQRLRAVMHPTDGLQMGIIETLHAHRQPCHTRLGIPAKARLLKRARIGFHGDFTLRLQGQTGAQCPDQAVYRVRYQHARGSAANEDAVHRAPPNQGQRRLQISQQSLDVALLRQCGRQLVGIEIAVGALLQTPRHMHIQ